MYNDAKMHERMRENNKDMKTHNWDYIILCTAYKYAALFSQLILIFSVHKDINPKIQEKMKDDVLQNLPQPYNEKDKELLVKSAKELGILVY